MGVKLPKLLLWKKLVFAVIIAGVILFLFISQSAEWKFTNNYNSLPLDIRTTIKNSRGNDNVNISLLISSLVNASVDERVIMRRHPYIRDSDCRNFSLSLYEDGTFDITGLVSFPGSGNTWARHLIQLATGVYTGSFYFDMELFAKGFLGERETWFSGRTIVQKFHEKYNSKLNIERAILLIREPFPAMLSFANYLEAGHTGNAYRLPYHHKDWPNFLLQSAYNWLSLAKSWVESPASLLVIHYENLRLQPVENMNKICKFLNHSCPFLLNPCFKKYLEGAFHRQNSVSSRKDHVRQSQYPAEIKNVVSRGIDHLNNLLRIHGHEGFPLKLYHHYNSKDSVVSDIS